MTTAGTDCPLVFCADQSAIQALTVLVYSILSGTPDRQHLVVLADRWTKDDRRLFSSMVAVFRTAQGESHNLELIDTDIKSMLLRLGCRLPEYHGSYACYLKLLVPDLLASSDFERIVLLDCDMLCCGNISELTRQAGEITLWGAVQEISEAAAANPLIIACSINTGTLLWHLPRLREMNFTKKALAFAREHADALHCPAAEIIGNVLPADELYTLEARFNEFHSDHIAIKQALLLHFAGEEKPWHAHSRWRLRRVYWTAYHISAAALFRGITITPRRRRLLIRLLASLRGLFNFCLSCRELIVGRRPAA